LQIFPNDSLYLYWIVPIISIGSGLSFPNVNSLVSQQAGPQAQGQVFGINQSIQSIAFAIPPIISGYLTTFNVNLPILLSSIVILCAWIFFTLKFKPNLPQTQFE
jgi:DHA1 family tetracycline resistance protein-like MFS transporter